MDLPNRSSFVHVRKEFKKDLDIHTSWLHLFERLFSLCSDFFSLPLMPLSQLVREHTSVVTGLKVNGYLSSDVHLPQK